MAIFGTNSVKAGPFPPRGVHDPPRRGSLKRGHRPHLLVQGFEKTRSHGTNGGNLQGSPRMGRGLLHILCGVTPARDGNGYHAGMYHVVAGAVLLKKPVCSPRGFAPAHVV